MTEEILDEIVVVTQLLSQRILVETIQRVVEPLVVKLHARIELVSLPLGTHFPEHIAIARIGPGVHPAILIVVVAMSLILETVTYLMSHRLTIAGCICPSRQSEQSDDIVDATAARLPLISMAQTDNHLISISLRLALVDGEILQTIGIELKYLVGSIQDALHTRWCRLAIASLPEENPMLRLHAALVAPLVVRILQVGIRTAGTSAAIDALIHTAYPAVQEVLCLGKLIGGQGIILHLLLGSGKRSLEVAHGCGLISLIAPPAQNLLGIVYTGLESCIERLGCMGIADGRKQGGTCCREGFHIINNVAIAIRCSLQGFLSLGGSLSQCLLYAVLDALLLKLIATLHQGAHFLHITIGIDGTYIRQGEVIHTEIVAGGILCIETNLDIILLIEHGKLHLVGFHRRHRRSGISGIDVGTRLLCTLVGGSIAVVLLNMQGSSRELIVSGRQALQGLRNIGSAQLLAHAHPRFHIGGSVLTAKHAVGLARHIGNHPVFGGIVFERRVLDIRCIIDRIIF